MHIAIIGAGNVGRALATAFTRSGHSVAVTSRDADEAAVVASATGARVVASNVAAAKSADIVILAIPFDSAQVVADEIREAVGGKPVVDVSNRMTFGPTGPAIDAGPLSRAQQLEQLAFLNIALNATNGWGWESGWKLAGAPASDLRVERHAA